MKLPIIVKRKRLLDALDAVGFSFLIWVFIHPDQSNETIEETIRHEKIHFRQQLELIFIFHWFLAGLFFCYLYLFTKYDPYYNNPFEKECYDNEKNINYLSERSNYAWIKYLTKNKNHEK